SAHWYRSFFYGFATMLVATTLSPRSALSLTTPAPTVSLLASPTTISPGQSVRLAWSASNATSCSRSGAWSGSAATWGVQSVYPSQSSIYVVTCTGAGGSASSAASVSVTGTAPVSVTGTAPVSVTGTAPVSVTGAAAAPASVSVTAPLPTISLTANPTSISAG